MLWAGAINCESADGGHFPLYEDSLPMVLAQGGGRLWRGYLTTYEGDAHFSGVSRCPAPQGPALVYLAEPGNGGIIPENPLIGAWMAAVELPGEAAAVKSILDFRGGGLSLSLIHISPPSPEGDGLKIEKMFEKCLDRFEHLLYF